MEQERLQTTVVALHHMVTLPKRLTVVNGSLSLLSIVGQYEYTNPHQRNSDNEDHKV